MARVGCHVRVTGRVQGVFFRAWTRDEAQRLGVAGWVRNSSDGSVEAHLEEDKVIVGQLIDQMREGPRGARVDNLSVEEATVEQFTTFEVRP